MLDSDSYSETCHNHFQNAMLMHSLNWLKSVHSTCYHRFAMVMMAMDGTFDDLLVQLALHRIVVANYCYSAFDIDRLER